MYHESADTKSLSSVDSEISGNLGLLKPHPEQFFGDDTTPSGLTYQEGALPSVLVLVADLTELYY